MSVLARIRSLLQDPPPEFAFEIAADGISMSRTRPPAALRQLPLPQGAIEPSPVKDNVHDAQAFAYVVDQLLPPAGSRGRRTAALILPDNSLRISVLDFETLPAKEEERLALIRFRLRKTLPFDVDEAALSYHVQAGNKVVVAVAPVEIVARYEAPFRAAGLHPGLVTSAALTLADLVPAKGSLLVAHRSPDAITVLALKDGVVTLARSLELTAGAADPMEEISTDIYPTLVYVEDQTGARPEKVILAGFAEESNAAATRLSVELDIPVEPLAIDPAFEACVGLAGYLKSLNPDSVKTGKAA